MDLTLQEPPKTPYKEYIAAIEVACHTLNPTDIEKLRADISSIFKESKPPKPYLTREEWKALKQLKSDKDCIIVTAAKGWY